MVSASFDTVDGRGAEACLLVVHVGNAMGIRKMHVLTIKIPTHKKGVGYESATSNCEMPTHQQRLRVPVRATGMVHFLLLLL